MRSFGKLRGLSGELENFDDWSWILGDGCAALIDAMCPRLFGVALLTACEMTAFERVIGDLIAAADMTKHVNACDFASLDSLLDFDLCFV